LAERVLSMHEVAGSIPAFSILLHIAWVMFFSVEKGLELDFLPKLVITSHEAFTRFFTRMCVENLVNACLG
jgi:hypothetical protein